MGGAVSSRSFDFSKSMIYDLKRSVDLRGLFDTVLHSSLNDLVSKVPLWKIFCCALSISRTMARAAQLQFQAGIGFSFAHSIRGQRESRFHIRSFFDLILVFDTRTRVLSFPEVSDLNGLTNVHANPGRPTIIKCAYDLSRIVLSTQFVNWTSIILLPIQTQVYSESSARLVTVMITKHQLNTMGLSPFKNCIRAMCPFAPILQGNNCFRLEYLDITLTFYIYLGTI